MYRIRESPAELVRSCHDSNLALAFQAKREIDGVLVHVTYVLYAWGVWRVVRELAGMEMITQQV